MLLKLGQKAPAADLIHPNPKTALVTTYTANQDKNASQFVTLTILCDFEGQAAKSAFPTTQQIN